MSIKYKKCSEEKCEKTIFDYFHFYSLVWGEGLATYVSYRLNPNATIEQVLLGETVAVKSKAVLPKLIRNIRENIDSGKPEIWKSLMSSGANDQCVPPRSGFYVSYLIASELGKKHSLQQMAQLQGEDLKRKMIKALGKLEKQSIEKKSK